MRSIKITNRIYLSLGVFVGLIVILGIAASLYMNSIWQNTRDLYDHPFAVQRAIGDLKSDLIEIRIEIKDMVVDTETEKIETHLEKMALYDADAVKQFDILRALYLGPVSDIDAAWQSYMKWNVARQETIRLFTSGNTDEAISRTRHDGAGGIEAEETLTNLAVIKDFAQDKATQLYTQAQLQKNQILWQLGLVIVFMLMMATFIGYLLIRSIKRPLFELGSAMSAFRQGRLDKRSDYTLKNEFGELSEAFNAMAASIQTRIMAKDNASSLSNALLSEERLLPFCAKLLSTLTASTDAQMGAVYMLNEQKTEYGFVDGIGLSDKAKKPFSANNLEGEFGLAVTTKSIQRIKDIDPETQISFSTVYGDYKAKEIITIPILKGSEVFAIVSIAAIHPFTPMAVELVNDIWKELCARLTSVAANSKINDYAKKLEDINSELDAQAKEVAMQRDELSEQNIELEMQKKLLDEASRLKSSFLSNMSHELRTPLNSVIALASVLNRRLADKIPEEEYSYLDVIERNGKHLLAVVNDILDLSRIEAGKEYVSISTFNLHQLIIEIADMIGPQAIEKNIRLIDETDPNLPDITSDLSKCRHILINIISNAVKFTDQGEVSVTAMRKGEEIHIAVTDTGSGIDSGKLNYIFDEFRQGDETTSRQNGGTGLGLAIARKYANLISGSIAVESEVGRGSTFTLILPMKIDATDRETEEFFEDRLAVTYQSGRMKLKGEDINILLVEDSEPAIIQMQDILNEQGYHVKIARNGKEALSQIEISLPDAMILDLMMPEVDGFQVLGAIRSMPKTSEIPVLILTAKHVSKEELKFLKSNHISQLIQKGSISKKDLLSSVDSMVSGMSTVIQQVDLGSDAPKPTILVVEDNPDNRMTVKALLQDSYEILEAADGETGIEAALKSKPDLILLDISLPSIDGFQVLDAIRKEKVTAHIPIVALTARVMTGDREKILDYGFDEYVSKPIDEAVLKGTIRSFLYGK